MLAFKICPHPQIWRLRLSEEFLEKHSEIPWHAIKAMRNLHAHDYDNINFEIVWETLTKDIPELEEALQKIII